MRLWQWWMVRTSSWGWRRRRRKRRRELMRRYHMVPNAKQIIQHLDMPRGMQDDILKRVKEAMWESEARSAKSKNTRRGT